MSFKRCPKCGDVKGLAEFHKAKANPDGRAYYCKTCANASTKAARDKSPELRAAIRGHRFTPDGWAAAVLCHMRQSAKRRGHPPPVWATPTAFRAYVETFHGDAFRALWTAWAEAGFATELRPSMDRLDDDRSYTADNLRLVTWKANRDKWSKSTTNRELAREKMRLLHAKRD